MSSLQPPNKSLGMPGLPSTDRTGPTTSVKHPPRRNSSARLTDSLYGYSAGVLLATSDYQTPNNLPQADKLSTMEVSLDIERMRRLIHDMTKLSKRNLFAPINNRMTLENLTKQLIGLRPLPVPKFVYLGGHAEWFRETQKFHYLPDDYAQGGTDSPLRSLPSKELDELLIDSASNQPTRMMLVTDFCHGNNFLGLRWVLRRNDHGEMCWVESEEFNPDAGSSGHSILHFAAGAKHQETYSFTCGSIFNRAFLNADYTGGNETAFPVPLSERLQLIQSDVAAYIKEYNKQREHCGQKVEEQEPQLYASLKLDLDDPKTLADLLHSL